jgi:hypothetical protein
MLAHRLNVEKADETPTIPPKKFLDKAVPELRCYLFYRSGPLRFLRTLQTAVIPLLALAPTRLVRHYTASFSRRSARLWFIKDCR